jgi:hypothetical protein
MKFYVTIVGATSRPDCFDSVDEANARQLTLTEANPGARVLIDSAEDEPVIEPPALTLLDRVMDNVRRRRRMRDGGFTTR